MKIIKILLILILTLFWAVILLFLSESASPTLFLVAVTIFYALLIYLVWPIGQSYAREAYKRLFVVTGVCGLALAANVLLSNECPHVPAYMAFTKSGGLSITLMFICGYLGKYLTFLFLLGVSCLVIYRGYQRTDPAYEKELLKKIE